MRSRLRAATALLAFALPAVPALAGDPDPGALLDRLEAAWKARDSEGYLALWDFATPAAREDEGDFARNRFTSAVGQFTLRRPQSVAADAERLDVGAQAFTMVEPRGVVESWLFRIEKRSSGWVLAGREALGRIDGLIHLSLEPNGFRADGLALQLEDFELAMSQGTLFTAPEAVGPTVLVFVGQGRVRFRPRPATEQGQLRHFCGAPELVERVRTAFIRIHPADLHRVLKPVRLEPDPESPRRLGLAQKVYQEQSGRSFVLDTALPGSPWWLFPGLGDALVTFDTPRRGTLTFTVSAGEVEGISLFDRTKRRQISLYPAGGAGTRYSEDDARTVDVLSHDLRVRFEPGRQALAAEDTLRLRLLSPALTVRLKLDGALAVHSITSKEAGDHLFFRIRHQNGVMVSLGSLAGRTGEVSLTVRYSGVLDPGPIEREVIEGLQLPQAGATVVDDIHLENVLVYTNRAAWYPQAGADDHAVASLRFDVPSGFSAVTGGLRTSARAEGNRTVVEYRQEQPGKYITVAVGRLWEAGERQEGPVSLRAFAVPLTRGDAATTLDLSAAILRFYAEEFGPCPYTSLNVVVVEGRTPGGHSPPGMVLLSKRPLRVKGALGDDPANLSDVPGFFLAHELAHQWWGHGIAGQNYHERWLSEGMAQYAAALWVRGSRGEGAFREVLRRMGRWALKTSEQGPISLGYRLGHLTEEPQVFRAVVYDKGAYVLHMLRGIVGEDGFRSALRSLQTRHRFGKLGTDDLREALEAVAGRDLSAYFREWVFGTALPRLHVSERIEHGSPSYRTVTSVRAERLPGPVPLEVTVVHEKGRETRRVTLGPEGGTWTVETPSAPRKLEVNGDGGLLATITRN